MPARWALGGLGGVCVDALDHVRISRDGLVYVCNRNGARIQIYDKMGSLKKISPKGTNADHIARTGHRTGG